jgi:uncharacterized protein (TIGR03067 family)
LTTDKSPATSAGSTMPPATDYYEILQVSPNADAAVIDAAYERLAQLRDPEVHPGNLSAGERMARINEAYAVLSIARKRREYDIVSGVLAAGAMSDAQAENREPTRSRQALPLKWGLLIAAATVVIALPAACLLSLLLGQRGESAGDEGATNGAGSPQQALLGAFDRIGGALGGEVAEQARAEASAQAAPERPAEVIFAEASVAVARVETYDQNSQGIALGTGFLVSADGLIATNYHVIRDAHHVRVTLRDGTNRRVEKIAAIVATRPMTDLALLKIPGGQFPYLRLAGDPLPPIGSKVYAIGNPQGLTNSLSDGLVSGLRELPDGRTFIQTTAAISHGSSGGPLLAKNGLVIGVTTGTRPGGQNLNLAVPISRLKEMIRAGGHVRSEPSMVRLEQDDVRKLEGDFSLVYSEFDGQPLSAAHIRTVHRSSKDGMTIVTVGGAVSTAAAYFIDPSKKPKAIDHLIDSGPEAGLHLKGIYEFSGDTVKICFAQPGQPRPTSFSTRIGNRETLGVWKRMKE